LVTPPPVITVSTMSMKRAMELMLEDYHIETMTCVVDPVQLPQNSPIVYNASHSRTWRRRASVKQLRALPGLLPHYTNVTNCISDTFATSSSTMSRLDTILQGHNLNGTSDLHRDAQRYLDLAEADSPMPIPPNPGNSPTLHNWTWVDRLPRGRRVHDRC
jgi:hypothetical protein